MRAGKLAIIANPHSGSGVGRALLREAKGRLWGYDCELILPKSALELTQICAALDPLEFKAAVVIGGDGTLNQAIRGLRHSRVPLYPFPAGTANDLAHELGIERDWAQLQYLMDRSAPSAIDLIEVNGHPFATVAGIGLGAVVTQEFNSLRSDSRVLKAIYRRTQEHMYSALAAKNVIFKAKSTYRINVNADGFHETIETSAFLICNQGSLGGNFKIAPEANNQDGRFEIVFFKRGSTLDFAHFLWDVMAGRYPHRSHRFSTRRLTLREVDGKPINLFGDGEILDSAPVLEFKIQPAALPVYQSVPELLSSPSLLRKTNTVRIGETVETRS